MKRFLLYLQFIAAVVGMAVALAAYFYMYLYRVEADGTVVITLSGWYAVLFYLGVYCTLFLLGEFWTHTVEKLKECPPTRKRRMGGPLDENWGDD